MKVIVRHRELPMLKGGAPARDGDVITTGSRRWTVRVYASGRWATVSTTDTPTGLPYTILVSPTSLCEARAMAASEAFDAGETPDDGGMYRRAA
mgnify:CR=1 FL=1